MTSIINPNDEYASWLIEIKKRIREAQTKAIVAVNSELIMLYWQIGHDIIQRQKNNGWGSKVIEQVAADLRKEFPDMKGFAPRSLSAMLAFAKAWPNKEILPQLVAKLPWGHNRLLLDKLKSTSEREWYAKASIENGWSRNVLLHHLETNAIVRFGSAITNFNKTLPAPQSELAQQLIKDPYILDFMTLEADAKERELENGLIEHLQAFLMELGKGFTFAGRQYHLSVGGQDFYLDLLFYNTDLHCYVVIDLKIDEFKPEYVGKMQFYLAAVDDLKKSDRDEPSIGLILCKTKNGIIAEYALRDSSKPIGIAEYKVLPPEIAKALPSIKELEVELSDDESAPPPPSGTKFGK